MLAARSVAVSGLGRPVLVLGCRTPRRVQGSHKALSTAGRHPRGPHRSHPWRTCALRLSRAESKVVEATGPADPYPSASGQSSRRVQHLIKSFCTIAIVQEPPSAPSKRLEMRFPFSFPGFRNTSQHKILPVRSSQNVFVPPCPQFFHAALVSRN
jgi:hypothetical protein